ncbi:MAG: marine proteobacterial sortase target protein [Gammaproteobacteria bacterium]|nr:marine proteobacterial sortase target protein [Gammaproteobacteria bacterium]
MPTITTNQLHRSGPALVKGRLIVLLLLLLWQLPQARGVDASTEMPPMEPGQVQRGSLLLHLVSGGVSMDAPMLKTDVKMDISGMLARVSVRQRFKNIGSEWAEGVYVFPLPEDAAVDRMRLRIGERIIEGEIKEKAEARRSYEKAKREGKKASLLRQERPNIFTTAVANIGPDEEVVVEIEYQQNLHYDQERFSIRFPLVVAPRYIPGAALARDEIKGFQASGWAKDTTQVPDASKITPPVIDPAHGKINQVSIEVRLDAGFPLAQLESSYHQMDSSRDEQGVHHLSLGDGQIPADRDFELTWLPAANTAPQAAMFKQHWEGSDYALMMVMPPAKVHADVGRTSREVVFVIDTSGSMHGESIDQARSALLLALQRLRPEDRFNVIQFNSNTSALFGGAVQATPNNIHKAMNYVAGLHADGGTEMLSALRLALRDGGAEGMLRQVIFLTDGSVGNEEELFNTIQQQLGDNRLFTVGIGSAPNSFFMTRAAQFGRGTFTYIGKVGEVKQKMLELFSKLESPMLTDISIQLADGVTADIRPRRIPDLYLGEPLLVTLRAEQAVAGMEVSGVLDGKPWSRNIDMQGGADSPGVHLLWARRAIADLMDEKARGKPESEVRPAVLNLALEHKLVTKYTSLVAVDKTPARPLDRGLQQKNIPTNLPHGWSAGKVFGSLPQSATPAPLHLLLGVLGLLAGWLVRRVEWLLGLWPRRATGS